jgi:hypothetical protein
MTASGATTNQPTAQTTTAATAATTAAMPQTGRGHRGAKSRARTTTVTSQPIVAPTNQIIEVTSTFIIAPFLYNAIFQERSSDPLKLIVLAWEAAMKFDICHRGMTGFANMSATDHTNTFAIWVLTIHLGQLDKARYTIDPGNNGLQNLLATRHTKCILPPLRAAGNISLHTLLGDNLFKSLGKGLMWMGEVAARPTYSRGKNYVLP